MIHPSLRQAGPTLDTPGFRLGGFALLGLARKAPTLDTLAFRLLGFAFPGLG